MQTSKTHDLLVVEAEGWLAAEERRGPSSEAHGRVCTHESVPQAKITESLEAVR